MNDNVDGRKDKSGMICYFIIPAMLITGLVVLFMLYDKSSTTKSININVAGKYSVTYTYSASDAKWIQMKQVRSAIEYSKNGEIFMTSIVFDESSYNMVKEVYMQEMEGISVEIIKNEDYETMYVDSNIDEIHEVIIIKCEIATGISTLYTSTTITLEEMKDIVDKIEVDVVIGGD